MSSKLSALRRAAALAAAGTVILGLAMPAQASVKGASASSSSGNAASAQPSPEKRYCFIFQKMGSRVKSKVCKTKAEWEAEGQSLDMK